MDSSSSSSGGVKSLRELATIAYSEYRNAFLELETRKLLDITRDLPIYADQITQEALREREDDSGEIKTLQIYCNHCKPEDKAENRIFLRLPDMSAHMMHLARRNRAKLLYSQLLLEILERLVPQDNHTRTINLLQVLLPDYAPPTQWLEKWKDYYTTRQRLTHRQGKVILKRFTVTKISPKVTDSLIRHEIGELMAVVQDPLSLALQLFNENTINKSDYDYICSRGITPLQMRTRLINAVMAQIGKYLFHRIEKHTHPNLVRSLQKAYWWLQENLHITFETLTILPDMSDIRVFSLLPRFELTTLRSVIINYRNTRMSDFSGQGVGIAVVPPPTHDELTNTTEVFKTLCPKSKVLDYAQREDPLTNRTVATAIDKLIARWSELRARRCESGEELHTLVALVHCGCSSFREDAMRAVNNAVSEGIVVVCPAGIDDIAFPASMGNVICVGAADENNRPLPISPASQYIDCLVQGPTENKEAHSATGSAATVAAGFIAVLCSRIGEVMKMTQPNTLYMYTHTAVVKEVLKETTQFRAHTTDKGYGLLTADVFSFSDSKLKKLVESLTTARRSREITISGESLADQCKYNTEVFANVELNDRMDAGVELTGNGIKITVIDDDFPTQLLHDEYKEAVSLEKESAKYNAQAVMLLKQLENLKQCARSTGEAAATLPEDPEWFEEALQSLKETTESVERTIDSLCKVEPVHESHGLQCALVLANIAPKAKLRLVDSSGDSADLAEAIRTQAEAKDNKPHIIVCSMAFDNFSPKLAGAINTAINNDIIPVFTAGNTGQISRNTISYPAKLGNVICIGAHSLYGSIQGFSSVGREVDFLAPGEFMVLDKYPVSGTSFAAPAAAAMIALVLEYINSKVVVEAENGIYATIKAWREYPPESGNWQWELTPIHQACRNVYVMRTLLRQISLDPTAHVHGTGHGLLDVTRLAIDLSPADLHRIVQTFYISDTSFHPQHLDEKHRKLPSSAVSAPPVMLTT